MTSTQEHLFDRTRPEPVDMCPENSGYRLPSEPTIMDVTQDMASDWLSYRNHPKNRPTSKVVSARYQADMESGRWREATPEGLIFDTEGYIISGAHRLKALANAELPAGKDSLRFWVFPNEPRAIFDVVDAGYKRTAAHLLRVPYATQLGSAARILAARADGDEWGMPRYSKVTTPEIVKTYAEWPELTWHTTDLFAIQVDAGVPMAAHAAVIAQAERTAHRDRIEEWLAGARTGAGLTMGDPRRHLRHRFRNGLTGGRGKRDEGYALIVKAWNTWALGKELTQLRHSSVEKLPRVEGFVFPNDEPEGK